MLILNYVRINWIQLEIKFNQLMKWKLRKANFNNTNAMIADWLVVVKMYGRQSATSKYVIDQ